MAGLVPLPQEPGFTPASTHWRELAKAEAARREKAESALEALRRRYKSEVDRRWIIESTIESKGFHMASPNRGLGLLTSSEEPTPRSSKWGTGKMNVLPDAFEEGLFEEDMGKGKPMYHMFMVVGATAGSYQEGAEVTGDCLMFQYPALAEKPSKVEMFCLPGGASTRGLKRTPSNSDLNQLLYGQGQATGSSNCFVFVLTEGLAGSSGMLYGVCVVNEELLHQRPTFMGGARGSPEKTPPGRMRATKRCYCLLYL